MRAIYMERRKKSISIWVVLLNWFFPQPKQRPQRNWLFGTLDIEISHIIYVWTCLEMTFKKIEWYKRGEIEKFQRMRDIIEEVRGKKRNKKVLGHKLKYRR